MKFRTEIEPLNLCGQITHRRPLLMLGSCFTDNIGSRLCDELFNVCHNPFGPLYNPASIHAIMSWVAECNEFTSDDIVFHDGLYRCWLAHSLISSQSPDSLLTILNSTLSRTRNLLAEASHLIITLGTAYVFALRGDGRIVANCHKLSPDTFTRTRLSVEQCSEYLKKVISLARSIKPDLKVIITVSPIRHIADGLHDNNLSKSSLILAADDIVESTDNVIYFPAYEAVVDDLRDYRFYATDMRHPSDSAVDYIYELFADSFFSGETKTLATQCRKLTRRMAHRHLTNNAEAIAHFQSETNHLASQLLLRAPYLQQALSSYIND